MMWAGPARQPRAGPLHLVSVLRKLNGATAFTGSGCWGEVIDRAVGRRDGHRCCRRTTVFLG